MSSLLAITVLLLVLTAHSSWVLLLPLSAGYLLFALFARSRTVAAPGPSSLQRETLAFTREATFGALVMGGMLPATMIFVRAFDTPTAAGMFAAALTLATPREHRRAGGEPGAPPPLRATARGPEARCAPPIGGCSPLTAAGFGLIFGALIVFAPWILDLFYGTRYADGVPAMQVLLGIVLLLSLTSAPSALLLASGRERLAARIWMFAFVNRHRHDAPARPPSGGSGERSSATLSEAAAVPSSSFCARSSRRPRLLTFEGTSPS